MAKVKFDWSFRLSNDKKELEIWLNDGVSRVIIIGHKDFYEHISDLLTEVNVFQFVHGTKTNIAPSNFNTLREAYGIHAVWKGNNNESE
jgi:hypothetical protein